MKISLHSIRRRFAVAILASLVGPFLSSCSMYPLGDSRYPQYFGGHGSAVRPNNHVPREIQRNNDFTLRS